MDTQRIGVFGGTFDPIHLGHLAAASEVCEQLALESVVLVPANEQPLKASPHASAEHRLAMCRAAVVGDPRLSVSDVDIKRGGLTFTVDTLADVAAEFPGADLTFIVGADALANVDKWREPERLRSLARFVGVTRPGFDRPAATADTVVVEVPGVAVSSTEVRNRVRDGASVRYLVPDVVVAYIEHNGLYLGGDA